MSDATPRPTLKDVAREAKVHFTTVSLALRGNPRIPAATRERIVRIAGQMGYRRDPVFMALTLRRIRTRTAGVRPRLAFLTNRPNQAAFDEAVYLRYFYEGARTRAAALGYECDLVFVGGRRGPADGLEEQLQQAHCEGLIVGALQPQFETVQLDWSRYALVKIDTRFMEPAAAVVSNDQMQVARLAFQRLRALGYRRIGLAVGQSDEAATQDLWAGACLIEQAGRPEGERVPPLHFGLREGPPHIAPRLRHWVERHGVDAVISTWGNIPDMVRAAGFRVPNELACACLSLDRPNPRLAGVIQNHGLVGQKAAEIVALNLKTEQRGIPPRAYATYVAGSWQDGASAPRRP